MQNDDDLILIESDGPILKFLCPEDNTIIECIADPVVPQRKIEKFRGTIIWSQDTSIATQVMVMKKICNKNLGMSNQEFMRIAREGKNWTFGEFYVDEAIDILKTAKKYNLNIEMIDIDSGKKLII